MRHYNGVVYYTAPGTRYYYVGTLSALIKTFRTFRYVPVRNRDCEFHVLFEFFKSFQLRLYASRFPRHSAGGRGKILFSRTVRKQTDLRRLYRPNRERRRKSVWVEL